MPPLESPRYYPEFAGVVPSDLGFKAWNYDPALGSTGTIMPTAGRLEVLKVKLRDDATITNVHMVMTVAGGTLTSARNFVGLFQGPTLLASSADMKATWEGSTGLLTMALATPQAAKAGDLFVGLYYTGTTAPTFLRCGASAGQGNGLFTGNASRFSSADTGLTTALPSSIGTMTATAPTWWVGLS